MTNRSHLYQRDKIMPLPTFFNLPEEKRQLLLDCAMDEFARHDYNTASISQIVARAGIAKGSLYQYFVNKQDLHRYLLELAAQKKAECMAEITAPVAGASVFETLRFMCEAALTFELRYPRLAQIGYRAINGNAPLPEETLTAARQSSRQYFSVLIEQGKQRGEIRASVDSDLAACVLVNALGGMNDYLKSRGLYDPNSDHPEALAHAHAAEIKNAFDQITAMLRGGIASESIKREDNQ